MIDDWFTIEAIDSDTYAISEYGHRERTHSYLLISDGSAVLIDTGLGIGNIKTVIDTLFTGAITVLTTHAHFDHTGGHGLFDYLLIHQAEFDYMPEYSKMPLEEVRRKLMKGPITAQLPVDFDINHYVPFQGEYQEVFTGDMRLPVGKRTLGLLHTPGHTPGHVCVYEEERGYLFSGDLLYKGIITVHDLAAHQASLKKLSDLRGVHRIFPGHNELIDEPKFITQVWSAMNLLERNEAIDESKVMRKFNGFGFLY